MGWGDVIKLLVIGAGIGASWYKLNQKLEDVKKAIEDETTNRLSLRLSIEKWMSKLSRKYDKRISKLEDKVDEMEKQFIEFLKKNFKKK